MNRLKVRALLGYANPYRAALALSALLMLLESAAALAIPWAAGRFAQSVLSRAPVANSAILLALLCLFAAQALLRFGNGYLLGQASASILADVRTRVYDHLQALPLQFYRERRHGDILALLAYEVGQLTGFITGTLLPLGPQVVTVAGAIVLMARIDALLAGLVALLVPAFYLVLRLTGRYLRPLGQKLQEADATAMAIAHENLNLLAAVKSFTRESEESRRFGLQIETVRNLSTRRQRIYAALQPATEFASAAIVVLLLWLASERIGAGLMGPSELVSFLLYAALLTRPISSLAATYGQVQMARGAFERMGNVLAERPELIDKAGPALPPLRGEVEFRDVHYAYPGQPKTLKGLNLRVQAGETVAITGANGAGKSTLAHLLMRLQEPCAGQILVDGIDVSTVSLHSLRSQIGIVPQHVLLFNATVRDNIGMGLPKADAQAIEHAARLAQAHHFITELPNGYDTLIGDGGMRLSGGQRQRLALARALLKDPPILVLDEATAMFDPAGERSFIEDCHQSFARRTVLLITHRPASLALADHVVLIKGGLAMDSSKCQ